MRIIIEARRVDTYLQVSIPRQSGGFRLSAAQSGWSGSLTRPRKLGAPSRCRLAPQVVLVESLVLGSCCRMYSRITVSSRPTVDTKYPPAQ